MQKRWEVVWFATGSVRRKGTHDSWHDNCREASDKAARMNSYCDGTATITYEVREVETEETDRVARAPRSERWIVQGKKNGMALTPRKYRSRHHARKMATFVQTDSQPGWVYTVERNPLDPEIPGGMRCVVWIRRSVFCAVVAIEAYLVAFVHLRWWIAALAIAANVPLNVIGEKHYWRYVNGLRRAARDRHDPGTSTSQNAGAPTGNANPTAGASPGSLTAGAAITFPAGMSTSAAIAQLTAAGRPINPSLTPSFNASRGVITFNGVQVGNISGLTIHNGLGNVVASYGTPTGNPLPEHEADVPIIAYKRASLCWQMDDDGIGPRLESEFQRIVYTDSDRMVCNAGYGHTEPSMDCRCGFYAVRERETITNDWRAESSVLIDVELFGKVIVYEHGYRSERQRMLRIGVAGCWYCHQEPSCVAGTAPTPWDNGNGLASLVPLCAEHLPIANANLVYSLDDLAERLHAPVGFEPSLKVDPGQWMGNS